MADSHEKQLEVLKVLFFGTHPHQTNGYSKAVYNLAKEMARVPSVRFSVFGFQRAGPIPGHREDLPDSVAVYDAAANETPRAHGFGFTEVAQHVLLVDPDVVVVFNDLFVTNVILEKLSQMPSRAKFRVVAYIDQVYLSQKRAHVELVNARADAMILFTRYWEANARKIGLALPSYCLEHAFCPRDNYPAPKALARRFFGLPPPDAAFAVLNLNRNQPRKRWDTCIAAYARFVAAARALPDYPGRPPPLLVVATDAHGAWDLDEVMVREFGKRGLSPSDVQRHVRYLRMPQRMSDAHVNILYNVADVGINTCDGEGFGLCQFDQAGMGIPQIVPRLGGFLDFFDDGNSLGVTPCAAFYVESSRDLIGGEAQISRAEDFAEALMRYYTDEGLRAEHGAAARRRILSGYRWPDKARALADICWDVFRRGKRPEGVRQGAAGVRARLLSLLSD
jgi:glycosyltransferase involved in cell wall biosynthesis